MDQVVETKFACDWPLEPGERGEGTVGSQLVGQPPVPFEPESDDNVVTIPAGDPQLLPERRFIPEPAREEIMKLFNVFLGHAKAADTSRTAFTEFMNVVRRDLGIPDNEHWNPSEEATYFEKQSGPVPPAGMTAEFVPEGGVPSQS